MKAKSKPTKSVPSVFHYFDLRPPGGGKGTLAEICQQCLFCSHVSIGSLLQGGDPGGKLLGDDVVISKWEEHLEEMGVFGDLSENLWIFHDGIPRTEFQANRVCEILSKAGQLEQSAFVIWTLSDDDAISRMWARRTRNQMEGTIRPDEDCDDKGFLVLCLRRVGIYRSNIKAITPVLKKWGIKTFNLRADGSIPDTAERFANILELPTQRFREHAEAIANRLAKKPAA